MLKKIYQYLPKNLKSNTSKIIYRIENRPMVLLNETIVSLPLKAKGGVIFSADFELGWAVRYSKLPKDPIQYAEQERNNIPIILKHLDDFKIPIVWSTIGHLFLESCKKGDHDWMRRIPYFNDHWNFTQGDWFDCDPYTYWEKADAWYAPDFIEAILKSKTYHEIACHTFSHIDCSYKNCPEGVIDDELKASADAAAKWGVIFKSLTFPGGTAGNYETLLKYGINICRKRHMNYELAYPFMNNNGVLISPTGPAIAMGYQQWSLDYLLSRYIDAIDKAIRYNSLVHFWFHPSQAPVTFVELFPKILRYCADRRDSGVLWVGTMAEISEHINNI